MESVPSDTNQTGNRRTNWYWYAFIAFIATIGFIGLCINAFKTKPKIEPVVYAAVPADVQHVEFGKGEHAIDLGYRVITPDWVIVTHNRSAQEPSSQGDAMIDSAKKSSRNLASLCRVAKKRGERVTFHGMPLVQPDGQPKKIDDKPVLIINSVTFGDEDFTFISN